MAMPTGGSVGCDDFSQSVSNDASVGKIAEGFLALIDCSVQILGQEI
jgi:hypothetical protein